MAREFDTSEGPGTRPTRRANIWVILLVGLAVLACICVLAFYVVPSILAIFQPTPAGGLLPFQQEISFWVQAAAV